MVGGQRLAKNLHRSFLRVKLLVLERSLAAAEAAQGKWVSDRHWQHGMHQKGTARFRCADSGLRTSSKAGNIPGGTMKTQKSTNNRKGGTVK